MSQHQNSSQQAQSTPTRAAATVTSSDARNADLADLVELLQDQQTRKHDLVAPATTVRARDGLIVVRGVDQEITLDGVTSVDGVYRPTRTFDAQIAEKLGIPGRYLSELRARRVDLYDANINGWLHGRTRVTSAGGREMIAEPDARSFLIRTLATNPTDDTDENGARGVARALLSDRYGIIDNLDALTAALSGVRAAGVEVEIAGCDLTDDRMYVRLHAPAVQALAPSLLAGYRSPFTGQSGSDLPVMFAGLHITNSETGGGAFTITPRLVVQVCTNGMTISKDAVRAVHLGGRLDTGIVRWTKDTERKQLDLITAKTADAVATFLDTDYLKAQIEGITEQANRPVPAATVVQSVAKTLKYSEETTRGVLDHFIRGGQTTAGGVLQAITSYAQTLTDAEAAHTLEGSAFRALDLAATA